VNTILPTTKNEAASTLSWYAILSRSRHEKVASAALTKSGITTFLPIVSQVRRWSDRRKIVEMPLFPGYLFVQIPNSSEAQLQVLKATGVAQFIGNRQGPIPVPDKEVAAVNAVLRAQVECSPYPFLRVGQRVRIRGGSLEGIEGILIAHESASKLVISIEIIQRSLAVSVYNFDVEPVLERPIGKHSLTPVRA